MSKTTAEYKGAGGARKCEGCSMFRQGEPGKCTLVDGPISPNATCKYWEARKQEEAKQDG